MLTGVIERKALEQTLIDEEDEDDDDDGRYLNLEGEDDGGFFCFSFFFGYPTQRIVVQRTFGTKIRRISRCSPTR
jgi:hypothetical protein